MDNKIQIEANLESIVATAAMILAERGEEDLSDLLYQSKAEVGGIEHDNWNGGTEYVTINIYSPIALYSELDEKTRENLESLISGVMSEITRDIESEHIRSLKILPQPVEFSVIEDMSLRKLGKGSIVKTAFDEYEIDSAIGQGGNGRVFSAKDSGGSECAIKFLDKNTSVSKYKRFKNEIHFCETKHHKNIVSIFDRGLVSVGGREYAFYVMPRYDKTLRDKMKEGLSSEQAVEIFIGILEGLKEAHRHNAIHRDIKPENILFAKNSDVPVICDFGIAHIAQEDLATTVVTKPSDRMANAVYKAPEQNPGMGGAVAQSDVYAAGLILNEMFTGQVPAGEGYETIGNKHSAYAYLDTIVSALYRQNAAERLYPIDRIITELKVRASIARNHESERLLQTVVDSNVIEQIRTPILAGTKFKKNNLIFKFDIMVPDEWLQILQQGSFDHKSVMSYETAKVARIDKSTLGMAVVYDESKDNILRVVECFRDWVYAVNAKYVALVSAWNRRRQVEEEESRKQEILRLERENEIQAALLSL